MRRRTAGPGARGPLVVIGVLLVAAAGCSDPPTRDQTDADLLVELHGARRATVTLEANDVGRFLSAVAEPRGGPPTTTSTTEPLDPAHMTPEQVTRLRATFLQGHHPHPDITVEIHDPRATFAAIGHALGHEARVAGVRVTPNRLVGTLQFGRPISGTRRVRPAVLARALDRGGLSHDDTVWVGVCVPTTQGRWARTPDSFDHIRGCTGWVPDRRATTVGVLVSGPHRSSLYWPEVGLALAVLTFAILGIARARTGRRRWHAILGAVALIGTLTAVAVLLQVTDQINDLHDTFATGTEQTVLEQAHTLVGIGVVVLVGGIGMLALLGSDPERRARRRRLDAFDDQPPNRSLRGSSV